MTFPSSGETVRIEKMHGPSTRVALHLISSHWLILRGLFEVSLKWRVEQCDIPVGFHEASDRECSNTSDSQPIVAESRLEEFSVLHTKSRHVVAFY
jgi:hypothetical protein